MYTDITPGLKPAIYSGEIQGPEGPCSLRFVRIFPHLKGEMWAPNLDHSIQMRMGMRM